MALLVIDKIAEWMMRPWLKLLIFGNRLMVDKQQGILRNCGDEDASTRL